MRPLHPRELANVLRLPPLQRYSHFIKSVIGSKLVWSLGNEQGWCLAADEDGVELVPLWPAPEYAQGCASGSWADSVPRSIPLEDFIEVWVPGMAGDHRQCTVFPTPNDRGPNVDPLKLREHLLDAIARIEYIDEP